MKSKRFVQYAISLIAGCILSCILLAVAALISNRALPTGPVETDRLSPLDKARLTEALRLKAELGDAIWPGWGNSDIPVIIWNRDYSFLTGLSNPPPAEWEEVPADTYNEEPYYRQHSNDPQNFAVKVGDHWVASMATKYETDAFMADVFREMLPSLLESIFPFRLLILPSEKQITGVIHESFHVYQVQVAQAQFDQAESIYPHEERYVEIDQLMKEDWEAEIDLLVKAINAETDDEVVEFTRQFIALRDERRSDHTMDSDLINFERYNEWLEGLAKYVELEIWRQAYHNPGYTPHSKLNSDPDFRGYETFDSNWKQEIDQLGHQANQQGQTRFYYTGMAQANILDILMPGWKTKIMQNGVFLEDLLREAVDQ
jgi:hypothetical protein